MKTKYLDIVEFIQFSGTHVDEDLKQLWRRIILAKNSKPNGHPPQRTNTDGVGI